MYQYIVAKLLFIHSVHDTITEGLKLEDKMYSYLKDGLLIDITVVRECMTALEQIKYSLYDAIIIYHNIDFITAQQFVRILRMMEDPTPVLFVTDTKTRIDPISYASEHGFAAVLFKPLNFEKLVHEILNIMNIAPNSDTLVATQAII